MLRETMFTRIRRGDARSPTRDNKQKTTGLFGLNDRTRQRVEKYCQDTPPTRLEDDAIRFSVAADGKSSYRVSICFALKAT